MEDLIALYLFTNKKCPLPELGTLTLTGTHASASMAERKIYAPVPAVKLKDSLMPADHFIQFIASKKRITIPEAGELLKQYCEKLQNMDAFGETRLPHVGKFYIDADGTLVFRSLEIPRLFLPDATAERVIHPDASHQMRVGDKETTSAEMTAWFAETGPATREKWWIAAIILALIAGAAIFFYFNDKDRSDTFGNTRSIQPKPASKTYQPAE